MVFLLYEDAFVAAPRVYHTIKLTSPLPVELVKISHKHQHGSVHASTVFLDDYNIQTWFNLTLVNPILWDCPHPNDFPREKSWNFCDYQTAIESCGLKVWDVQYDQRATGYMNIVGSDEQQVVLAGRADFIVSKKHATIASYLYDAVCVIEVQSHDDISSCEYQLLAYLLIFMNTRGMNVLFGFLVHNDGRCRAYKASRGSDGNCVYEQNDTFHVCYIADVIKELTAELH